MHLPQAVWNETIEAGRVRLDQLAILPHLQRHTLDQGMLELFVKQHSLATLQSGEKECLWLCMHESIPILLTDDLAVRAASKRLGITPVGALGIVVKAFQLRQITFQEAERDLNALYEASSLYVTRAIVELALAQLKNVP